MAAGQGATLRCLTPGFETHGAWPMRTFLTVAALLVLVSEPSWAQNFSQFGLPSARQYYLPPTYQYFTPPPRANRRGPPHASLAPIPPPAKSGRALGEWNRMS